MRTWILSAVAFAAIVTGSSWATVVLRKSSSVWDHFDEVKQGVLYRSGQLTMEQVEAAVKRYNIRTIVNLQMPDEEGHDERRLARELGVDFLNLPMPGDGFGLESQFRLALEAIDDPARSPVLVHCARGTCRTGATVALYRFERDGWTIEDVTAEMDRQTYRDGYLPGYIFAMVKNRPFMELYRPLVIEDRNRVEEIVPPEEDDLDLPVMPEPQVQEAPDDAR